MSSALSINPSLMASKSASNTPRQTPISTGPQSRSTANTPRGQNNPNGSTAVPLPPVNNGRGTSPRDQSILGAWSNNNVNSSSRPNSIDQPAPQKDPPMLRSRSNTMPNVLAGIENHDFNVNGSSEAVEFENSRLRGEVEALKAALSTQYRGGAKLVSGAQFRGSQRDLNKAPAVCKACKHMKEEIRRLRGEVEDSKQAPPPKNQVAEDEWKRKVNVLEIQKRTLEQQLEESKKLCAKLEKENKRPKTPEDCHECEAKSKNVKSLQNDVRKLNIDIETQQIKYGKLETSMNETQERCRQLAEESSAKETLRLEAVEAREKVVKELTVIQKEVEKLKLLLVQEQESLRKEMDSRIEAEKTVHALTDERNRLRADLAAKDDLLTEYKNKLEASERKNSNEQSGMLELRSKIKALEELQETLEKEKDNLKERLELEQEIQRDVAKQMKNLTIELETKDREVTDVRKQLGQSANRIAQLEGELKTERASKEQLEEQLAAEFKKMKEMEQKLADLTKENTKLSKKLADNEEKFNKMIEKTKTVLHEKDAQLMAMKECMETVKLTVMAPRVTLSFMGHSIDAVAKIKAQSDNLQQVLEDEFLPRYVKIFSSSDENGRRMADSASSKTVDPWMQKYLGEMRMEIENKIQNVLNEPRAAPMPETKSNAAGAAPSDVRDSRDGGMAGFRRYK